MVTLEQRKFEDWVRRAEIAAQGAEELADLTREMLKEFVDTFETLKSQFRRDVELKNDEIARLKNSSENDRSVATQQEMVNILQSLLDRTTDWESFYSQVEQLVQFLQIHRGEYVSPTQISLALTFV